jgi:protein required for attachment to host cells
MRVLEDCHHIALTCVYYYAPLQVLPQHLQEDIVNRLEDAVHIARVKCVCKSFQHAANRVRSLRIICKEAYHARVRELPRMVLPLPDPKRRHGRGGDRGTLSSSQAGAAADGLALGKQRTENDFTPNVPLPPTAQNSADTPGSGVHLQASQVDSNNNKHPREKVAEAQHADALHEVIPTGINVRRPTTRCQQEEDQSDVKICNWQRPSNQNSSDQALQNTSSNFLTYKEGLQETLRDDNGNRVSPGSTKKWKLQRDLSLLQGGEASTSVTKEEPDTCKGQHLQETLRDNNGNLLDRCSKKLKCEGRFQAGDSQAREVSMSVMKEAHDTCKGPLQETLKGDHGNSLDRCSKKPEHEGEFRLGDLHSGEASMSVMKEERDTYEKGHLQEMLRDDNGNFLDGSSKKPKLEGDVCVEDSQAGKVSTPETKKETDAQKGHLQETQRDDNDDFLSTSSKRLKLEGEFTAANPQDGDASTSGAGKEPIFFRQILPTVLQGLECVAQLRIEVEPKLQSKVVSEAERKCTDHWMTDVLFVNKWIRYVQSSIQHLCIVDYGQQAIMRRSSILTVISQTCECSLPPCSHIYTFFLMLARKDIMMLKWLVCPAEPSQSKSWLFSPNIVKSIIG